MLPFAVADVRHLVSCHLSATDATLQCAGACVADVPRLVAEFLYRRSETRGEPFRLNLAQHELEWVPCKLAEPTGDLDQQDESFIWRHPRAASFQRVVHINIQEFLACACEIWRRALAGERGKRILVILDSRVTVGAIGKGRSSSVGLNSALSIFLRVRVLFGITVCVLWVSTGANPSDAPIAPGAATSSQAAPSVHCAPL